MVYLSCPFDNKSRVDQYFSKMSQATHYTKVELETMGERIADAVEKSLVVHLSAKL